MDSINYRGRLGGKLVNYRFRGKKKVDGHFFALRFFYSQQIIFDDLPQKMYSVCTVYRLITEIQQFVFITPYTVARITILSPFFSLDRRFHVNIGNHGNTICMHFRRQYLHLRWSRRYESFDKIFHTALGHQILQNI